MTTLRNFLAPIAALLAVLVVVQTTDLVACADEAAVAEHAGESHAHGVVAQGAHLIPAPGGDHGDDPAGDHDHSGTMADCLCHLTFTPTTAVPAVAARPAPAAQEFAAFAAALPEVEPWVLDHVPLV
jgi:hypothetical protein